MVIRLAEKQGKLVGDLTPFQQFALNYSLVMERRDQAEAEESRLQEWSLVFRPDRFAQVFLPSHEEEVIDREIEGLGVTPDDFDAIDKFIRELDQKRTGGG